MTKTTTCFCIPKKLRDTKKDVDNDNDHHDANVIMKMTTRVSVSEELRDTKKER